MLLRIVYDEKALTQQYQLTSHDIQKGQHIGKCFSHVPIFPALEPCVVVGPQSAIVSWNKIALENALTGNKAATLSKVGFAGHWDWDAIEKANQQMGFLETPKRPGVITIEGVPMDNGFRYTFTWTKEARRE